MIRRVLVGLGGVETADGAYADSAIRAAVDIAKRHEARLTGLSVIDGAALEAVGPMPIGAGGVAAEMRRDRLEAAEKAAAASVERLAAARADAGLAGETIALERGQPFKELVERARYQDLTVVGLRGLFELGVMGEAQPDPALSMVNLIRGGVRPLIATAEEARPVNRVLFAYSGSHESAKALRRFVQLRVWPEAAVRLLAVGSDVEHRQALLRDAAAYCEDHGLSVETEHRTGPPQKVVIDAAHEWGADLLAMGNSHRTLLSRRVLGDTMLAAIQDARLPLFLSQ